MLKRLDNIGIAVSDAAASVDFYVGKLGFEGQAEGGEGSVQLGDISLYIFESKSASRDVGRGADYYSNPVGLDHLAFEVDDIEAEMARLAALGFQFLADEPRPGADGKQIVFLHPKSTGGVLVELCQSVEPTQISIPFKDGRLAAFVSGPENAPPLVVLHAALGSTELEMRRLTRLWEKDFRLYALDFMAHGKSDSFEGRKLTMESFVENVIALLDAVGIRKAHLFGFSMGGSVGLYAAFKHSERFGRLAIHAHNVQWIQSEADQMVGVMKAALAKPDSFWARRLAETHGTENWQDLVQRMITFTEAQPIRHFDNDDLATIAHPTLVSTGDSDRFFPMRHSLALYSSLPTASLAVLPGVDHPIQSVDTEVFASMIATHLLA